MKRKSKGIQLLFLFLVSLAVQLIPGFADNPSPSKVDSQSSRHKGGGRQVLFIILAAAAVVGLSFLLYKIWQKKKREEQHARLLRLFEEDGELELELGLRD